MLLILSPIQIRTNIDGNKSDIYLIVVLKVILILMDKIDFVVTWVDSNDPTFIEEYNKYREVKLEGDKARFRNWDFFKYWFRSIELYAPWVNKVFLITNGKYPDWINPSHPKLVLVKHSDYIPEKYLPTFNVRTIQLNYDKIEGLSEHFVDFNDDMYLNAPITPDYYFRNGLPCDRTEENLLNATRYDPVNMFFTNISIYCDVAVLNHHFNRKEVVRQSYRRWIGSYLSLRGMVTSILLTLLGKDKFEGFRDFHTEQPMLKSVIAELWEKEPLMMNKSCTRFRKNASLNSYIVKYWQLASNKFYPKKSEGKKLIMTKEFLPQIESLLKNNSVKSLCLNDTPKIPQSDYDYIKERVHKMFEEKFPTKSSFEK